MTANIKAMEIQLRNAVRAALAAQQRLSAARRVAGLRDRAAIYTAAEVKAMRVEWFQEFRAVVRGMQDPKVKRISELAIAALGNSRAAATAKELADQIVAAAAKARAGGPERQKPTGLAADILAAGKKRRNLS